MQKNWSIWISYRWEITPFYLNADNERSQVYKLSFSKGFWETNKSNWIANKTNLIERKTNKINWTSEGKQIKTIENRVKKNILDADLKSIAYFFLRG